MVSCSKDNEIKWTFRLLQRYSYENDDSIHLLRSFLGNISSNKESSRRRSIFSLMNSLGLLVISIEQWSFVPLSSLVYYYILNISFCPIFFNNDFFCYIHSPNIPTPLGLNLLNHPLPPLPNHHRKGNSNLPHLLPRRPPTPINRLPLRNNRLQPLILAHQKPRQKIPPSLLEHRHHRRWINMDLRGQLQNPIIHVGSLLVFSGGIRNCLGRISCHHYESAEIFVALCYCHCRDCQLCEFLCV